MQMLMFWNAMDKSFETSNGVALKDLNAFVQKDGMEAYEARRGAAGRSPPGGMKIMSQMPVRLRRRGGR